MSTNIVILAAGKSTRINSSIPKVMHLIAEREALGYVLESAAKASPTQIILVTAPEMEKVRSFASSQFPSIIHAIQNQPLGTADAVKAALPHIKQKGKTIILYGDAPLVETSTLENINHIEADLVLVAFYTQNPKHYGRVITYNDDLLEIVEFNDAIEEEKQINLCNSGIYVVSNDHLHQLVNSVKNNNNKKEYYLTDIIKQAVNQELVCKIHEADENEVIGFNTREELNILQNYMQQKIKSNLMNNGVTILNPESSYIAYNFQSGIDVTIYPNVYIGKNVVVGNDVNIHPFSHLEGVNIANNCNIGPFARIRPSTEIAANARIGNFVEIKNSKIGEGSKVSHLSYVGDCEMGNNTNIGAGSITCNYDGISKKSKTIIGDNVSIGSNCSLIAPIQINNKAFIAAGSVVTKDVAENDLVFARAKQVNLAGKAKSLREVKK